MKPINKFMAVVFLFTLLHEKEGKMGSNLEM
jgi:hypothetical protein